MWTPAVMGVPRAPGGGIVVSALISPEARSTKPPYFDVTRIGSIPAEMTVMCIPVASAVMPRVMVATKGLRSRVVVASSRENPRTRSGTRQNRVASSFVPHHTTVPPSASSGVARSSHPTPGAMKTAFPTTDRCGTRHGSSAPLMSPRAM